MRIQVSDLWRWQGTIDRGEYAFWGALLFAIKHNIDRIIASAIFDYKWSFLNYLIPKSSGSIFSITVDQQRLYATLLALALPFIYIGVVLTLRRLRASALPLWLVVLFFVPLLNLVFFLILAVLPSKPGERIVKVSRPAPARKFLQSLIPESAWGSAALALVVNVFSGLLFTKFSVQTLQNYGWGLFVGIPFSAGLTSVLIYGYRRPRSYGSCVGVSLCAVALLSAALFAFAIEGLVCLLMAAPLAAALAFLGGSLGYLIQSRHDKQEVLSTYSAMLLVVPFIMAFEAAQKSSSNVFVVRTSVEISATPQEVWKHVISFAELEEPKEWLFRIGIAYPIRAEISGHGVGAVRRCIFSTGAFLEPITIWNEPELLQFGVTSNPAPMQEWTPYASLHPPHLNGFLLSQQGQFRLIRLPEGRTRLEGATWYQHNLWPETYWKLWSDAIIHRIHLRVLAHIKKRAEGPRDVSATKS